MALLMRFRYLRGIKSSFGGTTALYWKHTGAISAIRIAVKQSEETLRAIQSGGVYRSYSSNYELSTTPANQMLE